MSRLVAPPTLAVFESSTMSGRRANYATSEDYQSRLAKYIPAEATGGYVALDNLARTLPKPEPAQSVAESAIGSVGPLAAVPQALLGLPLWPTLIFIACLMFAPLYVWQVARREKNAAWAPQAVIATVAFAIWAYAVHGALFEFGPIKHNPTVAGILLILFSMSIALYQPRPVMR